MRIQWIQIISLRQCLVLGKLAGNSYSTALGMLQFPFDLGGMMFFNNQDEFEAFIQKQGKVLKGIEDYEESTLPPAGTNFIGVWPSTPIGRINIFHSNGLGQVDKKQPAIFL